MTDTDVTMHCLNNNTQRGYTLVELMIAMAIIAIIAGIVSVTYSNYTETTRIAIATQQIRSLALVIEEYGHEKGKYPETLSDVQNGSLLDPWGHPFQYLNLNTTTTGEARKDRNLVPINTNFDLYSVGKDGLSKPPLTARTSQDDIIYANDGGYVGLASGY